MYWLARSLDRVTYHKSATTKRRSYGNEGLDVHVRTYITYAQHDRWQRTATARNVEASGHSDDGSTRILLSLCISIRSATDPQLRTV